MGGSTTASRDQGSVRAFIDDVRGFGGEAELISHRSRDTLDVVDQVGSVSVHMFAGLTDRQVEVLATAFEEGLLDVPSRGSMDGEATGHLEVHLRGAPPQGAATAGGQRLPFIRPGGD